jgi:hypothetical protein
MDTLEDRARRLLAGRAGVPPLQRRVEIMISGPLNRVGVVRQSLDDLQRRLLSEAGRNGDNLQLRVTAFLDGCRHTTPWSNRPVDAGASTNRWHCFRGQTRYAEAFQHSYSEQGRIDAIIMFGDSFDDAPLPTMEIAARLRDRGTRIFAFHVGRDRTSRFAYEQLAQQGGGVSVQLTDEQSFARVLPVITDYLFRPAETLRALPAAPKNPDVKALVDRLKALPPPSMPMPALSNPALAIKLPPLPPPVAAVAASPWDHPAKKV